MHPVARVALTKLLEQAESAWGRDSEERRNTLPFSESKLSGYLSLASHAQKQECNADLQLAERLGAIAIGWDLRAGEKRQISRIEVIDPGRLANLLEVTPLWDQVAAAERAFAEHAARYPVLGNVLAAWKRGVQVRGTRACDAGSWVDAVRVVRHCQDSAGADLSIRRVSTTLFSDSKRLAELWQHMDVLLQGEVGGVSRADEEVYGELGLVKFPPTLLLAGEATVAHEGCGGNPTTNLARPYLGFAPQAIKGFSRLESTRLLLSVENLTTFHEVTRLITPEDGRMVIYSAGMPSPSWLRVYKLLLNALPRHTEVRHWGDADAGGFRIAEHIAKAAGNAGRSLLLHGMDGQVPPANSVQVVRRALKDAEVAGIQRICSRWGWEAEAAWMDQSRCAVEQESLAPALPTK